MQTQLLTLVLLPVLVLGQPKPKKSPALDPDKQTILADLDRQFSKYAAISRQIWEFAEAGFHENKSSALLQDELTKAGFNVNAGVAGMPTAFVATFGSGKPVIALLAEFDALPGLATEAKPEFTPISGQKCGHGCGHNLLGTASLAAAIELKEWLKKEGRPGTIRLYGCPAEENGEGKVYMVREGLFNDVDVVLHWHPDEMNYADAVSTLALIAARVRFRGIAAHAAVAPERCRSALDGVEAMNYMVNMMRKHIPSDARIHYVITKGGEAPNVVPAFAEVYYYARHKDREVLKSIWKRVENAADGAAKGTGTQVDIEIEGGVFNILPNVTLAEAVYKNLKTVGGVQYTPAETTFAQKIAESLSAKTPIENAARISVFQPIYADMAGSGSTDVGDVSWVVPTAGFGTATWVPGTGPHSWQAVAASGMSIGQKGMLAAAKTLALSALDLYKTPVLIEKARKEWVDRRGVYFNYESFIGNRKPAVE
ncbi:amidohydrolase [Spirosoma sp. KUDC1026]|uniref:amidohydrolase n=1 Tax=Spirosoma sp. KUDC1026 TaxID=2745947 RepID=UPI00159B8F74|nr:amidohydrolase [Spirosoma sp. KUDC1026]QKZ13498.1 amidohydrolase [Spirosoma sp. KUDC1026]